MKTLPIAAATFLLFLSGTNLVTLAGQTAQQSATGQSASEVHASSLLVAVLSKSLDAAKAKTGEELQAKTTRELTVGDLLIPKNSKLIGHVTQAKPRADGAESELGFVFDRVMLKGGREVTLQAVIYQLSAPSEVASQDSAMTTGPSASPLPQSAGAGGSAGAAAVAAPTLSHTLGTTPNADLATTRGAAAPLPETKPGLFGFPKYALHIQNLPDGTTRSFITSKITNVKVEAGTQMVLRVVNR